MNAAYVINESPAGCVDRWSHPYLSFCQLSPLLRFHIGVPPFDVLSQEIRTIGFLSCDEKGGKRPLSAPHFIPDWMWRAYEAAHLLSGLQRGGPPF